MKHTLKRLLCLSLVLCLLLCAVPVFAASIDSYPFTGYTENGDGTVSVTGYTDHPYYDSSIEDTYLGMPVTTVASWSIKRVYDPNSDDFSLSEYRPATVYFPVSITTLESQIIANGTYSAVLHFPADAPTFEEDTFLNKNVTVYYPASNKTWDAVAGRFYGAKSVSWKPSCGHSYVDNVCIYCGDGCSHDYVDGPITQEFTCTSPGLQLRICSKCAYKEYVNLNADHRYVDGSCETCGQACSHDFAKGVWVSQPTCTVAGRKSYTCNLCGYIKYATFSATGHSFVKGVCTDCNFTAPDHDYVDSICIDCGRPLPEDVQPCVTHHFNRCVCTFCGTRCPYFDYHLEGGDDPCPVCGYRDRGYSVFDECDHMNRFGTWITKPTCTNMGKVRLDCNRCVDYRTVVVPAHGHEFVEDVCIYCNLSDSTVCQHSYVDGRCEHCGEADPNQVSGDVDGDYALTVADVAMIYAHVRGTQLLEGYSLQCADLNDDGQVDIVDTAIAYSRVKG